MAGFLFEKRNVAFTIFHTFLQSLEASFSKELSVHMIRACAYIAAIRTWASKAQSELSLRNVG